MSSHLEIWAPRTIRNRNPGAIRFGNFAKGHNAVGSDGLLAQFASVTDGIAAAIALLDQPRYCDAPTLYKLARTYSGSANSAYGDELGHLLGIDPTDTDWKHLLEPDDAAVAVGHAISTIEAGHEWLGIDDYRRVADMIETAAMLQSDVETQ